MSSDINKWALCHTGALSLPHIKCSYGGCDKCTEQERVIFSLNESSAYSLLQRAARRQLDPDCFQLSSIGAPQQGISESGSQWKSPAQFFFYSSLPPLFFFHWITLYPGCRKRRRGASSGFNGIKKNNKILEPIWLALLGSSAEYRPLHRTVIGRETVSWAGGAVTVQRAEPSQEVGLRFAKTLHKKGCFAFFFFKALLNLNWVILHWTNTFVETNWLPNHDAY